MPLDTKLLSLSRIYRNKPAQDVMKHALTGLNRVALVSSFGTESVVLLHMAAQIDRNTPVLFIDTEMLFEETLQYQQDIAKTLKLTNVQTIRPNREDVFEGDNENLMHLYDPNACCSFRKVKPLQGALKNFDGWITGRKRYQGGQREQLDLFEIERPFDAMPRAKVNPLANWSKSDVQIYMDRFDLPRHPLTSKGFGSVGCAPCTVKGQDRSGRWANQSKKECGIHLNGPSATQIPQFSDDSLNLTFNKSLTS